MSRTRTPSDQKWLLNERAVVLGELKVIESEMARLAHRKAWLEAVLGALNNVYGQLVLVLPLVTPPVVTAQDRYGGRGNGIHWVRETLRAAYPLAVDTATLTEGAARAFGLSFPTSVERGRFRRNSLRTALRHLMERGEAERLHDFQCVPHLAGVWRWVPPAAAFADIVAEAQALEMS